MEGVEDRAGVGPPVPDPERNAAVSVTDQLAESGSSLVGVALLEDVQGRADGEGGGRGPLRGKTSRTGLLDGVEGPPLLRQGLLVQRQDLRWREARQPVGDAAKEDAGQCPRSPNSARLGWGLSW